MINVIHHGPGTSGGTHEGLREDCSRPDCEWPRMGDLVTAMSGSVERTGKLVDFHIIRTSLRDEYVIARSTIRKPDQGAYCPHGLKVMEAVPAAHTCQPPRPPCTLGRDDLFHTCPEPEPCKGCHPETRMVESWPCDRPDCTREQLEQALDDEVEEYWAGINQLIAQQYD